MYVVTPRCAAAADAAVVSAVVLRRPTKEYTHPYSMMHRRLPTAGIEVAPQYYQLLVYVRTWYYHSRSPFTPHTTSRYRNDSHNRDDSQNTLSDEFSLRKMCQLFHVLKQHRPRVRPASLSYRDTKSVFTAL